MADFEIEFQLIESQFVSLFSEKKGQGQQPQELLKTQSLSDVTGKEEMWA